MFHFSPIAWYFVAGWTGVGLVLYYGYARKRERGKRVTPVVLRQELEHEERYRVLVPVAKPATARGLIKLAALLAREHEGEITLLHVIPVPPQTPLRVGRQFVQGAREEILDQAEEMLAAEGVPFNSAIRIAHKPAQAILDEVEERRVDMVVMGWRGPTRHRRTAIGSNIDLVLRHADCHVLVLRAPDLDEIRSILVPVADPVQAHLMLELANLLAREQGAAIDLYHALPPGLEGRPRQERLDEIYDALVDLEVGATGARAELDLDETTSVVSAVVARSRRYDLTLVGASREGLWRKLVAGNVPERILRHASGRLLLVKHRRRVVHSWLLDVVDFFRSTETVGAGREPGETGETAQ
jgi:nucleotide-binding universal stress UspA family protein